MSDMDIQSAEEDMQFEVLTNRHDKKLKIGTQAERLALSILNKRHRVPQLNKMIDNANTANRYQFALRTKQIGQFEHFLTRNKFRGQRAKVFQVVRELAQSKNYVLSGRVNMKQQRSKMVLRVVSKEDVGVVFVEDQTGKQKMTIKTGTIWVGMIALMEVTWVDNCYRLEALLDLGPRFQKMPTEIRNNSAYRMLFVKGSFMNHESKDNVGLKILFEEIRQLWYQQKTKIDSLVIMGPLLHKKNKVLRGFMQTTFDQQIVEITKVIRDEVNKISNQIHIVYVPSTDDITNIYPIPQPKYTHQKDLSENTIFNANTGSKTTFFTSNPGFINLVGKQSIKIDLLNTDVLNYIDQNRTGRSAIEIMQQNLETYMKQPFYLTNSTDEPFDQINIPSLYNQAVFGDIIVTSSRKCPPFARQVKGKVFLNIGCLNMQEGDDNTKHYMTLISIFDGTGHISGRTKVERLQM